MKEKYTMPLSKESEDEFVKTDGSADDLPTQESADPRIGNPMVEFNKQPLVENITTNTGKNFKATAGWQGGYKDGARLVCRLHLPNTHGDNMSPDEVRNWLKEDLPNQWVESTGLSRDELREIFEKFLDWVEKEVRSVWEKVKFKETYTKLEGGRLYK